MACLDTCKAAKCGDNFVQAGVEECDDGNTANRDACPGTCKNATCGDGFVQAGVEACDDGNQDDTDSCVQGCKAATCGDGFVRAGVEACDDGSVRCLGLNKGHYPGCLVAFEMTAGEHDWRLLGEWPPKEPRP